MRDQNGDEDGALPVQQVIARRLRHHRERLDLTQSALAQLMTTVLGFRWTGTTVAKIEADQRNTAADELIGLSLILRTPIADLLWNAPFDTNPGHERDMDTQVLIGSYRLSNIELRYLVDADGWPTITVPDDHSLSPAALAALTDDPRLRMEVDREMNDWQEGMRLLRRPVTDSARRAKRADVWAWIAGREDHAIDSYDPADYPDHDDEHGAT